MFDKDVLVKPRRGGSGPQVDPDSIRMTLNRRGKNHPNESTLRISIGKNLTKRMRWILGDRVQFCYGRRDRVIGLKKTNDKMMGNRLQAGTSTSGSLTVAFACSRFADDVKDIFMKWVGSGKVFPKVHDNHDTLYFYVSDAEEGDGDE